MKLLDFLNENENWQNILSEPPYSLSIKNDGIYYILKYNMLDSDLSIDIVQEARGSIFRFDDETNKWICVCHPFNKFFNFGESNASKIDWENSPIIYDKIDGCFTAKDRVLLADGSSVEIGKIVKNKMNVKVLSYNNKSNTIESKEIIGWKVSEKTCATEQFRTIKLKKVKTSLNGKLSQHNIITPTINHMFFRKGKNGNIEEVSAEKLIVNDILYTTKYGLTYIEKQVVLGTLLGDGSMTYYRKSDVTREKGIQFVHSRKQKDYVFYKYSLLKNLGGKPKDKNVKNSFNCEKTFYQSNTHSGISELYPIVYNNYKKQINKKWLEQLDWLGMAIWYMDDGHYDKSSVSGSINLHTEGFSKEENELIHNYYNDKGLKNYIRYNKKGYYYINFSTTASEIIWSHIAKYIPECMEYKLPDKFKGFFQDIVDTEKRPLYLCECIIEDIKEGLNCHNTYHSKSVLKYDIEVADNHNYFCQGVLVHNSLIKCWYDLGSWHISTNGVINAENAEVEGFSGTLNFLTLFKSAFGRENQLEKCYKFLNSLNKEYTYMFELVSPSNRLVVKYYFDKLYALSRRNKITDFEEPFNDYELSLFFNYGIEIPKVFNFDTIEDVIESARHLTLNNEGYVVCDKNYNRVKIKGEEYLKAFKIRGNLKITKKKVVQAILGGYIDDMIGFFGDEPKVTDTVEEFKNIKKDFESAWECIKKLNLPTRKDYAEEIKKLGAYSSYCFFKLSNPDKTIDDFIYNMHIDKLMLLFE